MAKLGTAPPEALVIHCSDPRFQTAFNEFKTEKLGLENGRYIPLIVPGSIGDLGTGNFLPKGFKILSGQISLFLQHNPNLHVVIINHEDCKAYANLMSKLHSVIRVPISQKQVDDLRFAARTIRQIAQRFGHSVRFELYMAKVRQPDGEVVFETVLED